MQYWGMRMEIEGIAMVSNKRSQDAPEKRAAAVSIEDALARLSKEDSKLGERMLNAAVAGTAPRERHRFPSSGCFTSNDLDWY